MKIPVHAIERAAELAFRVAAEHKWWATAIGIAGLLIFFTYWPGVRRWWKRHHQPKPPVTAPKDAGDK